MTTDADVLVVRILVVLSKDCRGICPVGLQVDTVATSSPHVVERM